MRPAWCMAYDRAIEAASDGLKPLKVQVVAIERLESLAFRDHPIPDEIQIAASVARSVGVPDAAIMYAITHRPPVPPPPPAAPMTPGGDESPTGAPTEAPNVGPPADKPPADVEAPPPAPPMTPYSTDGPNHPLGLRPLSPTVQPMDPSDAAALLASMPSARRGPKNALERFLWPVIEPLLVIKSAYGKFIFGIEEYLQGELDAVKNLERMKQMSTKLGNMAARNVLETDVAVLRATIAAANRMPIPVPVDELASYEAKANAAEVAQAAIVIVDKVAQAGGEGLLSVHTKELLEAIAAARRAGVPDAALARYVSIEHMAEDEQAHNVDLEALRALTSQDALEVDVTALREVLATAVGKGIPSGALEEYKDKMHAAESAQAEQTILDVVDAISDPQTMLSVNTAQLRAMLSTMNRNQAVSAFEKLEAKLALVDVTQEAVNHMEELGWPSGGVLKIKSAQLRIALDDATKASVPDELLERYRERKAEADEAQLLLKKKQQLEAEIRQAKADGMDDMDIGKIKHQLDGIHLSIQVLEG